MGWFQWLAPGAVRVGRLSSLVTVARRFPIFIFDRPGFFSNSFSKESLREHGSVPGTCGGLVFLLLCLLVPAIGYSANAPSLWTTSLTGVTTFPNPSSACVAAFQANTTPSTCPAGANYCWASGGPNAANENCTSVCSGDGCGGNSHCTSAEANCGYGADLAGICPSPSQQLDANTLQCVDPSSARLNSASCPSTKYPIALATGNKWLRENDLGGALGFSRTYNSNPGTLGSALGAGWRMDYGQHLGFDAAGTVWVYQSDGRATRYLMSSGNYIADADNPARLYRESTAGFRLETEDNRIERFDNAGRLTSRADAQGRTQFFTYDARNRLTGVTDHAGRQLAFAYDTRNRIAALIDPAGRRTSYAYDPAGNLSAVTYPDLRTRIYHYNEAAQTGGADLPHALTGITDENGDRHMSYSYDGTGRAIAEVSPSAGIDTNRHQLTYNTDSTAVTDPLGSTRTYHFQTILGVPRSTGSDQPGGSGCDPAASTASYDANGNATGRTGFDGSTTTYVYDLSRNLETQRVEASGTAQARTITTQWHGIWRLPVKTAEPKKLTSYFYNGDIDNGQPVACAPSGATVAIASGNQRISVLCKQIEQATTDGNGSSGLAAAIDTGVAQRVSSFTYDEQGRPLSDTDPLGRTVNYAYYGNTSFLGNVLADPSFQAVGLLLHGDGASGATTIVDHSLNPKSVTALGGTQLSTTQARFGQSILFNGGSLLSVPDSPSLELEAGDFTVEAWVYPTSTFGLNGGAPFAIIAGKDSVTERAWWFRLYSDPVDIKYIQVAVTSDGSSFESSTGDTSGATAIALNQWSHIAATRSGGFLRTFVNGVLANQSASTAAVRDTATPLTIGGQGWAGGEAYFPGYIDELRITKGVARYLAGFTVPTQAFPNAGPSTIDPNGLGHRAGDLQTITNAAGHVTQFTQYDRAGRVRQMIDPKGVITDTTYTPRGWTSGVTVTPPGGTARTTNYTYDNAGQLTGATLPDGTTLGYSYDAAHRLTGVTDAKGNSVTYTLDAMGNKTGEQVKDPSGNLQRNITRVYDALNRVQQVTGASN